MANRRRRRYDVADITGKDNMNWGDGHHWHTGWGGLLTLRGRVGYEYNSRTLIYGTAGIAAVNSSEYNIGDAATRGPTIPAGNGDGSPASVSNVQLPTAGAARSNTCTSIWLTTTVMARITVDTYTRTVSTSSVWA